MSIENKLEAKELLSQKIKANQQDELTIMELEKQIKELKKKIEKRNQFIEFLEKESKLTIGDVKQECNRNGLQVNQKGTWLWYSGESTGEMDRNKTIKDNTGTYEVIDKTKENELLKQLGFEYSTNKMQWYFIGQ